MYETFVPSMVELPHPDLLPASVVTRAMRFEVEEVSATALGVLVPDALSRAVPRRVAEYVAGRHCAQRALRVLRPSFEGSIATAADRAPVWPDGIVGSITHAAGYAAAAVAERTSIRGIGLDTERIVDAESQRSIRELVVTPADVAPHGLGLDVFYTLLFSAKESLFKCLYPTVGRFFGFETACVAQVTDEQLELRLLVDLGDELRTGSVYRGRWSIAPPFLHTAVWWDHSPMEAIRG